MNKEPIPNLGEWNQRQVEEMRSDDNRWFAGENLGHEPDEEEAALHYATHGGSDHFRDTHERSWLNRGKQDNEPV